MKIAIFGDFDISENYPNTKHFIASIEHDNRFELVEKTPSSAVGGNLYKAAKNPLRAIGILLGMFSKALHISWKIHRAKAHYCDVIYVPYPATIILFLYSLWPGRSAHRPLVVMDCFISLYDTVVLDRSLLREQGFAARLLRWVEMRAIKVADLIVTDTQANADFLHGLLGGNPAQWVFLNLSINEALFQPSQRDITGHFEVLFIGSFVPLQGVDIVVGAAIELCERTDIHFRLLGDGQTATEVESLLENTELNLDWDRDWHSIERIAEHYSNADICLGIFGATDKAARVLPYKVYMGLASGKPVISRRVDWLQTGEGEQPFAMVDENDPSALAMKISELVDSLEYRRDLCQAGRLYYERYLSNRTAIEGFYNTLRECLPEAQMGSE